MTSCVLRRGESCVILVLNQGHHGWWTVDCCVWPQEQSTNDMAGTLSSFCQASVHLLRAVCVQASILGVRCVA